MCISFTTQLVLWVLITLVFSGFAGILGKRYGVEYPIAFISALVVMAGVFANKIIEIGPLTVPAGVMVFSMTFFVTDIISEKWGKKEARKAVWAGFFSALVLAVSTHIVVGWQPAYESSKAFTEALSLTPRIAFAGIVAYLFSQHYDVWFFHFLKRKTKGKHLWMRNNLSTATSQLIDSIVFVSIAFYGVFPVIPLIFGQWIVKTVIAAIDTPFIYVVIRIMDKVKEKK